MVETIAEMITNLKHHSNVLGLVEYGSDHQSDNYSVGDYDLFVILTSKHPPVESLHFYISGIPVDLSLITLLGKIENVVSFNFYGEWGIKDCINASFNNWVEYANNGCGIIGPGFPN